jgi:hypothetical protein
MLTNLVRRSVYFGKIIVAQLVKKFRDSCETRGSLPSSEEPASDLILSKMNPVHILTCYLQIFFNIIFPTMPTLIFPTYFYPILISPSRARCPVHPIRIWGENDNRFCSVCMRCHRYYNTAIISQSSVAIIRQNYFSLFPCHQFSFKRKFVLLFRP